LLFSLVLVLIRPVPGVIAHTLLIIYAMLIDQTRIQPEIVSLVFLLWGTLPDSNASLIARTHLVSMWLFAGLNKFLSPAFMHGIATWILHGLIRNPPSWLSDNFGYIICVTEMGTGLLALLPRTRKYAGLMAFGLHMGILADLSPIGNNWNPSVWPWNVALAFAGFALIVPWKEGPLKSLANTPWFVRLLTILIFIAPAGFYLGVTDAYLAHNLYSDNVPSARIQSTFKYDTWAAFNVPLPPERRLFEQLFYLTCRPGDQMTIHDSRWWFRVRGFEDESFSCPSSP
jgi:hypothetical protein